MQGMIFSDCELSAPESYVPDTADRLRASRFPAGCVCRKELIMKKTIVLVLVTLLALVLALSGCSGNKKATNTSDKVINIGVNYELSGAVASYGSDSQKGVQMAIDQVNKAGGVLGKQIKLITLDDKSDATESASVAAKLMDQDNVVACLGPATSGNFIATIPSAMSSKTPIISASATANTATKDASGNVYKYVFRICYTDDFQGSTMATYAKNKLGAKTAAIYKDTSSDYAKGLATSFKSTFEKLGGKIVAEEGYVSGDTDFRAVLTDLKSKGCDVLFVPGYYQEAGLIIAQARQMGINVPILGADGFDSPTLLKLAGAKALTDVYFSNHYSSLDKDPLTQQFIKDWGAANNGASPSAFNALGYDLGKFIADAITRAGSTDKEAITKAIADTQSFAGVTGTFSMGADHNPIKSVVVINMQNGQQASAEKVATQ
jgi:branched-chain amino acid transport system substrate-binding protein